MTEPTITCPKCKTEIKLTESLAAPLIESTRKQFEQQLAQKDNDIARREVQIERVMGVMVGMYGDLQGSRRRRLMG